MGKILENYYNNKVIKTVLGKKSTLNGNLQFKNSIKINGKFSGNIVSEGLLYIGEGAVLEANIKAKNVVVCGTVKGNIYSEERVEMLPTGRVYGDVESRKIKISDGVIFNGSCKRIK